MNIEQQLTELAEELVENQINLSWIDWYILLYRETSPTEWKQQFESLAQQSNKPRKELARHFKQQYKTARRKQQYA